MNLIASLRNKIRGEGQPPVTEALVRQALSKVQDPDLHQDIVTLGFVTSVVISGGQVSVVVNLTTPACPVKEQLKTQCEQVIKDLPGVTEVDVTMTAKQRVVTGTKAVEATTNAQVSALANVRHLIAVASGKGGVAKSTTAVNLAYSLAKSGAKVGLLDADVYGPSLPQMLRGTVLTESAHSVEQKMIPPTADGIKVVSLGMFAPDARASILRGPMAGGVVKQFLTQVEWGELDYLIIDYPPGTGDIQLTISQTAVLTGAVVVTTPQEVSLIDVRKALDMFKTLKVPILGVIETMSYFICDGCDKKHDIFRSGGGEKLSREYGVTLLGQIPMDPTVVIGGDEGTPQVLQRQESPAAKAYQEATGVLVRRVAIMEAERLGSSRGLDGFELTWQVEPASGAEAEGGESIPTDFKGQSHPSNKPLGSGKSVDLRVLEIKQRGARQLEIQWTDQSISRLDVVKLRHSCPCASCIDEWSGEKRLRPEQVSDTVRPVKLKSVGSYAVQIWFNDGHSTGIYTYQLLRDLGGLPA